MAKIECKIEDWWISSCMMPNDRACSLFGNIFGHPAHPDDEFVTVNLLRADFINLIAETEDAYIKLGEPQSLDRVMNKLPRKERR